MKILGIETSCDETAVSVLDITKNKITVLSNTISSQVKLHAKYGGVVPNLAAREHVKNIEHVFKLALKEAGVKDFKKEIDLMAVTRGPGLGPALLVGITFAKTVAWKYQKPLIGVNHLEGHVYSNWLKPVGIKSVIRNSQFPILNLIVSGGHTELVLMEDYGQYKIIGETLDDAIGEAFDKVARLLGLGYPGGPQIARCAEQFAQNNADTTQKNAEKRPNVPRNSALSQRGSAGEFRFPRPMIYSKNYNFSYSGLKTSVLYKIRDLEESGIKLNKDIVDEICYEFQLAATDVLIKKTIKAAKEFDVKSIFLSGGVSANKHLRLELEKAAKELEVNYSQPEFEYTGDNAAMIALAGYFSTKNPPSPMAPEDTDWKSVEMDANLGF